MAGASGVSDGRALGEQDATQALLAPWIRQLCIELLHVRHVVGLVEELPRGEVGPGSRHVVALQVGLEDGLEVALKTFEGGGYATSLPADRLELVQVVADHLVLRFVAFEISLLLLVVAWQDLGVTWSPLLPLSHSSLPLLFVFALLSAPSLLPLALVELPNLRLERPPLLRAQVV